MGKLTTFDALKRDFQRNGSFPSMGWIKFTPTEARKHLEHAEGHNFRKKSEITATRYSEDIENGDWELNAETVKFNKAGICIDGQHRLFACTIAKKPLITAVAYGVKDDQNIDTGYKRSLAMLFRREGVPNYMEMATSIKWVYALMTDTRVARRCLSSNRHAMAAFHTEKNLVKYAPLTQYKGKLREAGIHMGCGGMIATLYLAAHKRPALQIHQDFLESLVSGEGVKGDTLVFRNLMMTEEWLAYSGDMAAYKKAVGFIKAWNAWIGKKRTPTATKSKFLDMPNGQNYPKIELVPAKYRDNPFRSKRAGGKLGAKVDKAPGTTKKKASKRKVPRKK